jgi:hypothetical protein
LGVKILFKNFSDRTSIFKPSYIKQKGTALSDYSLLLFQADKDLLSKSFFYHQILPFFDFSSLFESAGFSSIP